MAFNAEATADFMAVVWKGYLKERLTRIDTYFYWILLLLLPPNHINVNA